MGKLFKLAFKQNSDNKISSSLDHQQKKKNKKQTNKQNKKHTLVRRFLLYVYN